MENTVHNTTQIEDRQLEMVTGGDNSSTSKTGKDGTYHFTGHVTKYKGVVGQRYFFTKDNEDVWYMGILVKSFEEDYAIFWSRRKHLISVILSRGYPLSKTITISGDDWTMYTTCDKIP